MSGQKIRNERFDKGKDTGKGKFTLSFLLYV